jgi:hypothetical protein
MTMIQIQDTLIAQIQRATHNMHVTNARARARRALCALGYTDTEARAIVRDADDMAHLLRLCRDATPLNEAWQYAEAAADKHGLPQTLYSDAESCGWWHTNALANRVHAPGVLLHVTILPANYFQA